MEQITIITRDYHGLTADITSALGSNDINIESLDAKKIDDIGLVMLRVNQYDRALEHPARCRLERHYRGCTAGPR